MMKRAALSLIALTASAAMVAGCGSNSLDSGESGKKEKVTVQENKDAASMVPAAIKKKGTLRVGTDASYAPSEFMAGDGKTIQGFDIDLMNAVAKKLGLKATFQNADFGTIITGVEGNKYDVGVSSFSINSERLKQANMTSYFNAGTQWATQKGNPDKIDPTKPCGLSVSVQRATVQHEQDLPPKVAACKKQGKPLKVLPYTGQDQATAAVASGKVQAMLADSPVIAYAVKQSKDKIEALGDIYDAAPYGYVTSKENKKLAEAFAAALKDLEADGSYEKVLKNWGVEQGGLDSFDVNPKP